MSTNALDIVIQFGGNGHLLIKIHEPRDIKYDSNDTNRFVHWGVIFLLSSEIYPEVIVPTTNIVNM